MAERAQQQTHLVQQQHQPQQQPPPQPHQNKPKSLDVLAQTLQLSEISADLDFDFEPAEPVRMGGNLIPPSETQVPNKIIFSHCFFARQ